MEKMNPEIKAQWVAALRSGEYKQALSALRLDDPAGGSGYCCLGVLCDISGQGEWEEGGYRTKGGYLSSAYLPEGVRRWAGINNDDPSVGGGPEDYLSHKNDSGATFAEIADLIEQNF
jgi:hypothetical protein